MTLFPVAVRAGLACSTVSLVLASLSLSDEAIAQIRTDSSLGRPGQMLNGPAFVIPETLGRLSGRNLFHSFQTFNIRTGESANFTTTSPALANVISRVTGGTLSQINGELKLTAASGTPNFFFINPAGVTFGAGASIDVPGAFHVSTANYIKFPDGNFHADLSQASTFSSAAPEAFGFLGTTRASITISDGAQLATQPLQPTSIVGGDVRVDNARVASTTGDIRVAAVGQATQDVGFSGVMPALQGNLLILDGGSISSRTSSSASAGSVKVSAGSIHIDGQGILSDTNGAGDAGVIEVSVARDLAIVNGGKISSRTSSTSTSGNAGSVKVSAGSISIDGRGGLAGILSDTTGAGDAGVVEVSASRNLSIVDGGQISSSTFSSGDAGVVRVNAANIAMVGRGRNADILDPTSISVDPTSISAGAALGSAGQTGDVTVTASDSITLSNRANLSIRNAATVPDPALLVPTTLSVSAPNITLKDAQINAASRGNVASSDIQINFTNRLFLGPTSAITTSASLGNGGAITVQGGKLIVLESSRINTSVFGLAGDGGNISLSAHTLFMNTGFIQANTAAANASGGLVNVNVQSLVASAHSLFVGGEVPFLFRPGFNVIQAAAPTGVSGTVQVTSPALDVSGSLRQLNARAIDAGGLSRSLCQTTGGSSLAPAGRGGLAPSDRNLLRAEPDAPMPLTQSVPLFGRNTQFVAGGWGCI